MALTPAQLEKKITDLEKKVSGLASAKDVSDAEDRMGKKIDNVKAGSGGTDSNVAELQRRLGNIDKSISSLVDSVDKINEKLKDK